MDLHKLKQRIDASGEKLVTLGNEYIKSKNEFAARKVLVKILGATSPSSNPHLSILRLPFCAPLPCI